MTDVLAVDIGGTNLRTGWVNSADLQATDFEIRSSLELLEVADPQAALLGHLQDYLARTAAGRQAAAIAIGFPATIDAERKVVLSTSNIRSMQQLPIVDYLEAALDIPVFIDKDVNMLLRYDIRANDLPDAGVVIGCYAGTGFGNAISINGNILTGTHGVAGELGHLPTTSIDRVCGCGNVGCIETVASGKTLAEIVAASFPGESISHVFRDHSQAPEIVEFIRNLAIPIAAEINILDPAAVVVGGGLIYMDYFPRTALEEAVYSFTRKPLPANATKFVYSSGGQHNGVIGAGLYALENLAARVS